MTLQLAYTTSFELKSQPLKEQSQFAKKGRIGLDGPAIDPQCELLRCQTQNFLYARMVPLSVVSG